jgi:chromodomain-containing protein
VITNVVKGETTLGLGHAGASGQQRAARRGAGRRRQLRCDAHAAALRRPCTCTYARAHPHCQAWVGLALSTQAHYIDQRRRAVTFAVGDSVLLSTEHLRLVGSDSRTPKFTYRFIGPFKVKRVVNANAYELDLPPQLQIHPVLNISRLKAYRDGHEQFPDRARLDDRPPPEVAREDGAHQYEVESIMARRGAARRLQYLVKWRGYPHWEATWEPASALTQARQAVREFERIAAAQQ